MSFLNVSTGVQAYKRYSRDIHQGNVTLLLDRMQVMIVGRIKCHIDL